MSTPPDTGSTSLGETRKLFAGRRAEARVRDLSDTRQVFELANEIAEGDTRRACLLSIAESQAIARLAVAGGALIGLAVGLVDASDADDTDEIRMRLLALCRFTRELMEKDQP